MATIRSSFCRSNPFLSLRAEIMLSPRRSEQVRLSKSKLIITSKIIRLHKIKEARDWSKMMNPPRS